MAETTALQATSSLSTVPVVVSTPSDDPLSYRSLNLSERKKIDDADPLLDVQHRDLKRKDDGLITKDACAKKSCITRPHIVSSDSPEDEQMAETTASNASSSPLTFPSVVSQPSDDPLSYRSLDLSEWKEIDDAKLLRYVQHLDLTRVNLYECSNITDEAVIAIATHCPNLMDLNLAKCSKITDEAVIAIATHCHGLTHIDLYECSNITDLSAHTIAAHCPNVIELNLSKCSNITDAAVIDIAQHCPNLIKLSLSRCSNITDEAVKALATYCPKLIILQLIDCDKITDQSLNEIAKNYVEFKYADLSNCVNITQEGLKALKDTNPQVRIRLQGNNRKREEALLNCLALSH